MVYFISRFSFSTNLSAAFVPFEFIRLNALFISCTPFILRGPKSLPSHKQCPVDRFTNTHSQSTHTHHAFKNSFKKIYDHVMG